MQSNSAAPLFMRGNSDGVCDRDTPRPQADSLCFQHNNIAPGSLNNSHLQLSLGLCTAQDVAGRGGAVRLRQVSVTEQSLWAPDGVHPRGCRGLQPVAPSLGSLPLPLTAELTHMP